jgi:predicted metal-binding protein
MIHTTTKNRSTYCSEAFEKKKTHFSLADTASIAFIDCGVLNSKKVLHYHSNIKEALSCKK